MRLPLEICQKIMSIEMDTKLEKKAELLEQNGKEAVIILYHDGTWEKKSKDEVYEKKD